jgi:hypothetical protein
MANRINKSCEQCMNKGTWATKLSIFLCQVCRKLPKYTLISKTDAKDNYFLSPDELVNFEKIYANSSYGPATYYRKEDLVNKFCEKFNTDLEHYIGVRLRLAQEHWEKIQQKRAKREANREANI